MWSDPIAAVMRWSLEHRGAVVVGWLLVAAAGLWSAARIPMDAFPDTTPVQVQINTVAPSLSPLEVERRITAPVEQSLSGLPGLQEVRSLSKFGLSQVTCLFEDGTDIWRARTVVGERLSQVELPADTERPRLGPVATGLGEVFHYLVSGQRPLAELRTLQDWVIAPQLRAVPGVAEVNSWGGDERQVQVVVDPAELEAHGLSLPELVEALQHDHGNAGGGPLDQGGGTALVQGIGLLSSPEDVGSIVLGAREGVPLRVRDVARVVEGREIRRGAVTADGQGEVVLGLGFLLLGENSHEVSERLSLRLQEIRRGLPEDVQLEPVYVRTTLVEQVLHTVAENLAVGAGLVVAVLLAMLGNLRAGLIVAGAIPLSMLCAASGMWAFGIAGSVMSLGAIDFGLLVESSVIQVENAVRRLAHEPGSQLEIVRDAALEVRRPTMFGELILAIVYVPILTLEGMEGRLFRPMAMTVLMALAGSMALSLTLVPVVSSLWLPRRPAERESALVRGLHRLYLPALRRVLLQPGTVLVVAGVVLLNGGLLATQLGSEFVPRLGEGTLVINTVRLSGVSLDESVRYGSRIERVLLEQFPDEVARVWTRTGTAEVATDPMGVELSDVFLQLRPRAQWTRAASQPELVELMSAELSSMPGMRVGFTQPIEMRINEMVAGIRSDVGVKVFGDDLDVLKAKAREIAEVLETLAGAADVATEPMTGQPVVQVTLDRDALARHGVPARDVLAAIGALGGLEVAEVQEGERRFPVAVRLHDRYRADAAALGRIAVTTGQGHRIPLAQLARIELAESPATVFREWGKRRVVVEANVRGRDLGTFVAQARRELDARVDLPEGYYVRFGGQFEHLQRARERLMIVVPLALAAIFALLYATYRRVVDAALVFVGVPFAAVGGVLSLWLRDLPLSVSAAVGFVALSGVAVLGELVLVSTIRQRLDEGMALADAVRSAAEQRLRPVLMTALVASLGFVPMAFNTGIGGEVQRPLATVVIGGIVTSTALTLVVLPALVLYVLGRQRPAAGET
jgi:cobalt-zinc-cadmium resistance protein CzcA